MLVNDLIFNSAGRCGGFLPHSAMAGIFELAGSGGRRGGGLSVVRRQVRGWAGDGEKSGTMECFLFPGRLCFAKIKRGASRPAVFGDECWGGDCGSLLKWFSRRFGCDRGR